MTASKNTTTFQRYWNVLPTIILILTTLFAHSYAKAEILSNIEIDGFTYDLDTETLKAKVKHGPEHNSPYHLVIPESTVYDSKTYIVTEIADVSSTNAYSNGRITGITFPNTIVYIGNWAFKDCWNFEGDLIIPNSVKHIGQLTFENCAGTGKLILGNGLEYIGKHAFSECNFTGDLILPETTNYIGDGAFHSCKGFTGSLRIPDSVVFLGNSAFRTMSGISGELYIGKSVNSIGVSCFDGTCNNLDKIEIYGNNLDIVNTTGNPFSSQNSTCKHIYLSNQVKSISRDIFTTAGYTNIEEVISDNTTPPVFTDTNSSGEGFLGTIKQNAVLKVPAGSIPAYKAAKYWKDFVNIQELKTQPTGVKLNETELSIYIGESFQLIATISPDDVDNSSVKWISPNETILSVDSNGKITANAVGEAQITATTHNMLSATCHVTVKPVLTSEIALNLQSLTLAPGQSEMLTATVLPENATNKMIRWSSENENVATVDSEGYVTAIFSGVTKITASATDDSGIFAECTVTVSKTVGINDILLDKSAYVKIFDLKGVLIYEGIYAEANLTPDYYIVVCDGKSAKVKIK